MTLNLDNVDRGILYRLQEDARTATANEIGDTVGVSASTVRNRIERLESDGIIRGYHPELDYEQAGFQLHALVECHAPPEKRAEIAQQALDLHGVVRVRELLTGTSNVHIEAIAPETDAVDDLVEGLTDLGFEIDSTNLVKRDYVQPFDHLGKDIVDD